MALTVFCPQAKEKGPCQTPLKCSGQLMCAHLKAMMDRAKQDSQLPQHSSPTERK